MHTIPHLSLIHPGQCHYSVLKTAPIIGLNTCSLTLCNFIFSLSDSVMSICTGGNKTENVKVMVTVPLLSLGLLRGVEGWVTVRNWFLCHWAQNHSPGLRSLLGLGWVWGHLSQHLVRKPIPAKNQVHWLQQDPSLLQDRTGDEQSQPLGGGRRWGSAVHLQGQMEGAEMFSVDFAAWLSWFMQSWGLTAPTYSHIQRCDQFWSPCSQLKDRVMGSVSWAFCGEWLHQVNYSDFSACVGVCFLLQMPWVQ